MYFTAMKVYLLVTHACHLCLYSGTNTASPPYIPFENHYNFHLEVKNELNNIFATKMSSWPSLTCVLWDQKILKCKHCYNRYTCCV